MLGSLLALLFLALAAALAFWPLYFSWRRETMVIWIYLTIAVVAWYAYTLHAVATDHAHYHPEEGIGRSFAFLFKSLFALVYLSCSAIRLGLRTFGKRARDAGGDG